VDEEQGAADRGASQDRRGGERRRDATLIYDPERRLGERRAREERRDDERREGEGPSD
jgi:hypothetical protein